MKSPKTDKDNTEPQAKPSRKPLSKSSSATTPRVAAKKSEQTAIQVAADVVKEIKGGKTLKANKKLKLKVIRDSFTMPASEHQKIADIKDLCLKSNMLVKKSEVLRAGLIALSAMDEEQLKSTLCSLDKIKTGRPNK